MAAAAVHSRGRSVIATGLAITAAALIGCDFSDSLDPSHQPLGAARMSGADLDRQLRELLLDRSGGHDLTFFSLPEDHQLNRIPQDPRNPLTQVKVRLGALLYHETALAVGSARPEGRGTYSCAACHHAQGGFAANLPQGIGEGGSGFGTRGEGRTALPQYDSDPDSPDVQPIRTPTSLNTAYQELMLWNGQFGGIGENLGTEDQWLPDTPLEHNWLGLHGLETQAFAGLSVHRMGDILQSRLTTLPRYSGLFRAAFPGESDPINRMNAAFALAAYERTLLANRAPFQQWLRGNHRSMSDAQKRGGILFFGDAGCVACHTGPALGSMTFHALGMNDLDTGCDMDRVNLAPFEDTIPDKVRRGRGGFTGRAEDAYAFKTPQLYNIVDSPFYGHGASFATVRDVIAYKNAAIPENANVPTSQLATEFHPLGLTSAQIDDLVSFVEDALYDPDLSRYVPQRLPSRNCFPVNDPQSQEDLDCDPSP